MRKSAKAQKSLKFEYKSAPDIKKRVKVLSASLGLDHLSLSDIYFYRSSGSKSRAYARTWGLPRIWQESLNAKPSYVIEVISKYFDNLTPPDQDKVLLHEITHIPKNFSGALIPHTKRGKRSFHKKLDDLIDMYFLNKNTKD